jgi:hypothetical protein
MPLWFPQTHSEKSESSIYKGFSAMGGVSALRKFLNEMLLPVRSKLSARAKLSLAGAQGLSTVPVICKPLGLPTAAPSPKDIPYFQVVSTKYTTQAHRL